MVQSQFRKQILCAEIWDCHCLFDSNANEYCAHAHSHTLEAPPPTV